MENKNNLCHKTVLKLKETEKGKLLYYKTLLKNPLDVKKCLEEWIAPPKITISKRYTTQKSEGIGDSAWTQYRGQNYTNNSTTSVFDAEFNNKSDNTSQPRQSPIPNNSIITASTDSEVASLGDSTFAAVRPMLIESSEYLASRNNLCKFQNVWNNKAETNTHMMLTGIKTLASSAKFKKLLSPSELWKMKLPLLDRITMDAKKEHRKRFRDNTEILRKRMEQQLRNLELFEISREERTSNEASAHNQQDLLEVEKNVEKLKEHHYNRKLVLEGQFKEAETRKHQLHEKAELEAKQRLHNLRELKSRLTVSCGALLAAYEACQYKQHLPATCKKIHELMTWINEKSESLVTEAEATGGGDVYMKKMQVLFDQAVNASELLNMHIEEANKQGGVERAEAEQRAQVERAEAEQRAQVERAEAEQRAQEEINQTTQQSHVSSVIAAAQLTGVDLCVDIAAYAEYSDLMKRLTEVEQSVETFVRDPRNNQLRFSLQKSVNIPLNAISSVNGRHLRDKLSRFRSLLSGQTVEVGSKRVSAKSHPLGLDFCKNLLAKMIVKKAEEQVSSKHETAFPIAMVTVAVCSEFVDVRELLLAHFYRSCPYLVPYYISKEEGQSDEDYHRSRGYKYEEGTVEKQDKFLKRMSGFMYMYAAIMVSYPPANAPHVFDIQNAWLWLTRVLNMDPEPDVTATLLNDLLQVCGSSLFRVYKKQFSKLLRILLTEYMTKIDQVVISGGPVSRLRVFLQDCVTSGRIREPDGLLSANFWNT